ncbi:hypothetical protein JCM10213_006855 [Rhodosporidiobolus nylandii]
MDPPLSPHEQAQLDQLNAITARSSEEENRRSLELLRDVGWNVERREGLTTAAGLAMRRSQAGEPGQAALRVQFEVGLAAVARIFDGTESSGAQHAYPPPSHDDNTGVHDELLPSTSSPRAGAPRPRVSGTGGLGTGQVGLYYLRQALAVPITILSYPAALLYNIGTVLLTLLARLFHLRPSATASFRPRNPFTALSRPRTILSPVAASEAWIRSVEAASELACPSLSQSNAIGEASGVQVGSSSGLSARRTQQQAREGERRLPAFFVGGYEAALKKAKDEMRLLMVVLSSEEHELDRAFKRDILSDPALVKELEEENVLVWGGDVGERDAFQVGQTLSYISLPFLAFISLQPTGPNSLNPATAPLTSPRLRLISRLESNSTTGPLIAPTIHTHLLRTVVPKSRPFLNRLAAQKAQRDADRREREATELRLLQSAKRDEERVLAFRRKEAEQRKAEEARRAAEEQAAVEQAEREHLAALARRWRAAKRAELASRGEPSASEKAQTRCVVRLGDGRRVMRAFSAQDGVERVYEWVECELSAPEDAGEQGGEQPEGYEQRYHFRLATAFPRWVLPLPSHLASPSTAHLASAEGGMTVGQAFDGQGGTVILVVDGLEERRRMSMSSRDDSDEDEWEEEAEEAE